MSIVINNPSGKTCQENSVDIAHRAPETEFTTLEPGIAVIRGTPYNAVFRYAIS